MIETIYLGSSPACEDCAQTTDPDYHVKARAECKRYKALLLNHYAAKHAGKECPAKVSIKSNAHDFGTYYEVVVQFDWGDEKQVRAAYWLEANSPEYWNAENELAAAVEFGKKEYARRHGR